MDIRYIDKDQLWQTETTNYWFDVDGHSFAIADQNGNLSLLDAQGYPVIVDWRLEPLQDALIAEYRKHIDD